LQARFEFIGWEGVPLIEGREKLFHRSIPPVISQILLNGDLLDESSAGFGGADNGVEDAGGLS